MVTWRRQLSFCKGWNDLELNVVAYLYMITVCTRKQSLDHGWCVHGLITTEGFECNLLICNALINMYLKCRSFDDAKSVYDGMPIHDVVTWNAMIAAACSQPDQRNKGLVLFQRMQESGLCPNQITYVSVECICRPFGFIPWTACSFTYWRE